MKTAAILVLAFTIALVKSEDCKYKGYGWGDTVEAVVKKFDGCKKTNDNGKDFAKCMNNADEGMFITCSSDGKTFSTGIYDNIGNCLEAVKKSCQKKPGTYNHAKVFIDGTITVFYGEGNRRWYG